MTIQALSGMVPEAGPALTNLAGLPLGWVVLNHPTLAMPGEAPIAVDYVLLHPAHGIAILDVAPAPVPDSGRPDAVQRLREMLDTVQFRAIFGKYPPIIYHTTSADRLHLLRRTLEAAFREEPPLDLPGGQSWMGSALRLLSVNARTAKAPMPSPQPAAARSAIIPRDRDWAHEREWAREQEWARERPRPRPVRRPRRARRSPARPMILGAVLAGGLGCLLIGLYQLDGASAPGAPPPPASQAGIVPEAVAAPQRPAHWEPPAALPTAAPAVMPAAAPMPAAFDAIRPEMKSSGSGAALHAAAPAVMPPAASAPASFDATMPEMEPSESVSAQATAAPAAKDAALATPPAPVEPPPVVASAPPPATVLVSLPEPPEVPPPARAPQARTLSPGMVAVLLRRGNEMRELGDFSAARALLTRAAEAGSAPAAMALAATWDPARLDPSQASIADPDRALEWYRRAMAYGDASAAEAINRLQGAGRP